MKKVMSGGPPDTPREPALGRSADPQDTSGEEEMDKSAPPWVKHGPRHLLAHSEKTLCAFIFAHHSYCLCHPTHR